MDKKKYSDLSCKREKVPIQIEKKYLVKLKRKGFDYSKDYITNCFIKNRNIEEFKLPYEYRCNCDDSKCDTINCKCINNNTQKYECNINCNCQSNVCLNRKASLGITHQLRVEFSPKKGFGVFCGENIKKDSFICSYMGEIVNKDLAEKLIEENFKNKKENYIIKAKEDYGEMSTVTCIDASNKGNVSRFFNHSCDPNLYLDVVRTNNFIPNISFFALRDIQQNEELTFCYNNRTDESGYEKSYKKCYCGANNCREYLPSS
jgi:SET domain-containing protein